MQVRRAFEEQFKQFDRGGRKFCQRATPSDDEIMRHVHKEHQQATKKHQKRDELRATALEIAAIEQDARAAVRKEVKEIQGSRQYGYVSKSKPEDTVQIMFENFNSLGVLASGKARRKKIRRLRQLHKEYNVDLFAGCKTQCN